MEAISLSILVKPFVAIGKALAPIFKQLRAERQAGADSASIKTALLDHMSAERGATRLTVCR